MTSYTIETVEWVFL